ncbi:MULTISPECIES: 5-oxoprolinase subunit C family protein [Sphingobacterium]|uniref:Biotin-dependent carboxyltransferase family protein n=1 Tax=Sphingobacterium populi TaxID=1812824 RepID=A0ABW5UBS6_9SPHI|nr:biotin-dependent carboxyltransferase family protein [Sphingobacterium sp. CFCC 11742]
MAIKLLKAGPFSSIQDLGRLDYLSFGVPKAGAMDTLSVRIANEALRNAAQAAVIELTYAQAEIEILSDMLLAYAGQGAVLANGKIPLPANRPLALVKGTRLKLIPDGMGCRTYLATTGGWDVPIAMGSRSTYLQAKIGGINGRLLQNGDILCATAWTTEHQSFFTQLQQSNRSFPLWYIGSGRNLTTPDIPVIRVVRGPEADWFSTESWHKFLSSAFEVDRNSNRMGYILEGHDIQRINKAELLSTAVLPGTIQIPGNGRPVLLMADCQTTGGYPRIAQVAAIDLPLCGQLKPGDQIYFQEISTKEAEVLYLDEQYYFQKIRRAIDLRYYTK